MRQVSKSDDVLKAQTGMAAVHNFKFYVKAIEVRC